MLTKQTDGKARNRRPANKRRVDTGTGGEEAFAPNKNSEQAEHKKRASARCVRKVAA